MKSKIPFLIFTITFCLLAFGIQAQSFNHPGTLHSQADLERMKQKVAEKAEPWYGNWQQLQNSPHAQLWWSPRPSATICRACPAGTSDNYIPMARDIAAAYGCALRWHITGDSAYANKAISTLNVWGSTLTSVYGGTDAQLSRGTYGYEFAVIGDLMYNYGKWNTTDKATFKKMLLTVFLQPCLDFLNGHYGTQDSHYRCNWDGFAMSAVMAIGIFSDSTEIVDYAINYYKNGVGNGNINHAANFIHDGDLAQWEESGRDQPHTTFGSGLIGLVCQMAWNQGVDLFAYGDNRLLKAVEYIAKYNSFNYVPYKSHTFWYRAKVSWPVYTNTEHYVSGYQRGFLAPVYELAYNHYVNIKGLNAPYLTQMASRTRPEKGGGYNGPNSGGYDILGYGTLAFTLKAGSTSQSITFNPQSTYKTCAFYDLGATSTSGKTVRYSTSDSYIADIIDNKLYARRPGSVTITAWCNGDSTHASATSVSKTITIHNEEIIFSGKYNITTDGWKMIECNGGTTDTLSCLFYDRYDYNNVRINQYWNIKPKPQHWSIYRIHGNYYKIINVANGYALSLSKKDTVANTKVVVRQYAGSKDQLWKIERSDSIPTGFVIKNLVNGLLLSRVSNYNDDYTAIEVRSSENIAE